MADEINGLTFLYASLSLLFLSAVYRWVGLSASGSWQAGMIFKYSECVSNFLLFKGCFHLLSRSGGGCALTWMVYQTFLLLSLLGVSVKRGSRKGIITWRINPDDERNHHGNCQSCCSWELMQTGGCDCYSKSEPQSSSWHANSL